MKNIKVERNGNLLVLTIDMSQTFGPSSSGKTTIIASSEGNAPIPGEKVAKFGLNVFTK